MKGLQLVIPAAGLGSRFAAIGITTPKPVIDVLGLPMIAWVIGNFKLTSSDTVIIVTRPELGIEEKLSKFLARIEFHVDYIYVDYVPEGPAISVSLAKPSLNLEAPLIVANSDQYVSANLDAFENSVRNSQNAGQILTMNASDAKWSFVTRDKRGLVSDVKEKVKISDEATVGIYGWSRGKDFFDSLDSMILANDRTNGEFYVAPSYSYLINNGSEVSPINIGDLENHVHGLGTPEDLDIFRKNERSAIFLGTVKNNLHLAGLDHE